MFTNLNDVIEYKSSISDNIFDWFAHNIFSCDIVGDRVVGFYTKVYKDGSRRTTQLGSKSVKEMQQYKSEVAELLENMINDDK